MNRGGQESIGHIVLLTGERRPGQWENALDGLKRSWQESKGQEKAKTCKRRSSSGESTERILLPLRVLSATSAISIISVEHEPSVARIEGTSQLTAIYDRLMRLQGRDRDDDRTRDNGAWYWRQQPKRSVDATVSVSPIMLPVPSPFVPWAADPRARPLCVPRRARSPAWLHEFVLFYFILLLLLQIPSGQSGI
ncbi:hypothetical protein BDW60DRAFT_70434 [Aspergillus nidulans var. acristatus]|jgi:hypothetical protein